MFPIETKRGHGWHFPYLERISPVSSDQCESNGALTAVLNAVILDHPMIDVFLSGPVPGTVLLDSQGGGGQGILGSEYGIVPLLVGDDKG